MAAREELIALLRACAAGDQDALERLYRSAGPKLYGLALRIVKEEGLAQECLQDAFLRIWKHAGAYREDLGAPMTWMGVIVRRRALDMVRSASRERVLERPEDLERLLDARAGEGAPEPDAPDRSALEECLGELRGEQRRAVELAYLEGLTHPELAARLEVPLGTVKTWVRRALLQLRKCLDP